MRLPFLVLVLLLQLAPLALAQSGSGLDSALPAQGCLERQKFPLDNQFMLGLAGLELAFALMVALTSSVFIGIGALRNLMRHPLYRAFYENQHYYSWALLAVSVLLSLLIIKSLI